MATEPPPRSCGFSPARLLTMAAASRNGRANRLSGETESSRAIPSIQQIPADQRAVDIDDQRRLGRGLVGRPAARSLRMALRRNALEEIVARNVHRGNEPFTPAIMRNVSDRVYQDGERGWGHPSRPGGRGQAGQSWARRGTALVARGERPRDPPGEAPAPGAKRHRTIAGEQSVEIVPAETGQHPALVHGDGPLAAPRGRQPGCARHPGGSRSTPREPPSGNRARACGPNPHCDQSRPPDRVRGCPLRVSR